jgi:hypothetical protein
MSRVWTHEIRLATATTVAGWAGYKHVKMYNTALGGLSLLKYGHESRRLTVRIHTFLKSHVFPNVYHPVR